MGAIAASRWPGGLPAAGSPAIPEGLSVGLAINAGLAAGAAVIAWFWLPRHRASPEQQSTFTRSSDQDTKLQASNSG